MSTTAVEALTRILVFVAYVGRLAYAIVHLKPLSASFIDAPARFGKELLGFFFCLVPEKTEIGVKIEKPLFQAW